MQENRKKRKRDMEMKMKRMSKNKISSNKQKAKKKEFVSINIEPSSCKISNDLINFVDDYNPNLSGYRNYNNQDIYTCNQALLTSNVYDKDKHNSKSHHENAEAIEESLLLKCNSYAKSKCNASSQTTNRRAVISSKNAVHTYNDAVFYAPHNKFDSSIKDKLNVATQTENFQKKILYGPPIDVHYCKLCESSTHIEGNQSNEKKCIISTKVERERRQNILKDRKIQPQIQKVKHFLTQTDNLKNETGYNEQTENNSDEDFQNAEKICKYWKSLQKNPSLENEANETQVLSVMRRDIEEAASTSCESDSLYNSQRSLMQIPRTSKERKYLVKDGVDTNKRYKDSDTYQQRFSPKRNNRGSTLHIPPNKISDRPGSQPLLSSRNTRHYLNGSHLESLHLRDTNCNPDLIENRSCRQKQLQNERTKIINRKSSSSIYLPSCQAQENEERYFGNFRYSNDNYRKPSLRTEHKLHVRNSIEGREFQKQNGRYINKMIPRSTYRNENFTDDTLVKEANNEISDQSKIDNEDRDYPNVEAIKRLKVMYPHIDNNIHEGNMRVISQVKEVIRMKGIKKN